MDKNDLDDPVQSIDDLTQNIYVELYKSLSKFDTTRSFNTWLYGIMIKQLHSQRRKKWRQHRGEVKEMQLNCHLSHSDFSTSLIEKICNQSVIEDLQPLSFKLKSVIVLHYFNEFTQKEISEMLHIPLGTVKSRLHAAIKQLRKNTGRKSNV